MIARKLAALLAFSLLLLGIAPSAEASHFRYGTVRWRVPNPALPYQVEFTFEVALRRSFYSPLPVAGGSPVVLGGVTITNTTTPATLTSPALNVTPVVVYNNEDWFIGTSTFTYTFPSTPGQTYKVNYTDCCRISTLLEGNSDTTYNVWTTLRPGPGSPTISPRVSLLPVVTATANQAFSLQVPGVDGSGFPLTYRFATAGESGLATAKPATLTMTQAGLIQWTPIVQGLYALQIVAVGMTGGGAPSGTVTPIEFILNVVAPPPGNPPVVTIGGSATPSIIDVYPGLEAQIPIVATDPEFGPVTLVSGVLPLGATLTPTLPVTQLSPVSATLRWTPGIGVGDQTVSFQATDNVGHQRINSVILRIGQVSTMYASGIIRDFSPVDPDFNRPDGDNAIRLVATTLGADGKPVFQPSAPQSTVASASSFNQWFNRPGGQVLTIPLSAYGADTSLYTFNSTNFFPIDGQMLGNAGAPHNNFFTYEVHMPYQYLAGQVLQYSSSDDLWVFINGRLAVDLGGIHTAPRTATLNVDARAAEFGLEVGQTYRMDIFYAHRGGHAPQLALQAPQTVVCDPVGSLGTVTPGTMTRVGTATVSGIDLRLIGPEHVTSAGAAWTPTPQVIGNGFRGHFTFRMTPGTGIGQGFALVLQAQASNALGLAGPELGYGGITNSLAIEFDPRVDTALADPLFPHISIHARPGLANSANENFSYGRSLGVVDEGTGTPISISDGLSHFVRFQYVPGFLQGSIAGVIRVWFDDAIIPTAQAFIDDATMAALFPTGAAYAGFTSSSAPGVLSEVRIQNFQLGIPAVTLTSLVTPPAAQLPGETGQMVIHARDACNNKLYVGGAAAAFTATMNSGPYVTPVTIIDNNDGTYTFRYTPPVGGPWTLNIRLNGVLIAGAPFTVPVARSTPILSATGGTFPYNGLHHPATGSATGVLAESLGPLTFAYAPFVSAVEGGVHTATGSFAGNLNYEPATTTTTVTVTPVLPSLTVVGGVHTFDGLPKAAVVSATGISGEALGPVTITYNGLPALPVDAGSYLVSADFTGNSNYLPRTVGGTLTVLPALPTVSVVGGTFVFDGAAHPALATVTGVGGTPLGPATLTYDGSTDAPVDAGTYPVLASFAGGGNYAPASATGQVVITQATPTVNVTGGTFVYDGQPHPASGTVTGVGGATLGTPTFTYDGSADVPVNAGAYAVQGAFAGNNNYTAATGSATLTINRGAATVTVSSATLVYNGAPQAATGTVTGVGGVSLGAPTFTYDGGGAPPVNAGTYAVIGTFAGDANHEPATGGGTLTIGKAQPDLALIIQTPQYFTGSPVPVQAFATGVNGEPLPVTVTYDGSPNPPTNAGAYTVLATFAGNDNYHPQTRTGILPIQRAPSSLMAGDEIRTYNGSPQVATYALLVRGPGGTVEVTYDGSPTPPTDAGDYQVDVTYSGDENYEGAHARAMLRILRATATVAVTGGPFMYDGQPHAATGTVTGVGGAAVGAATLTYDGLGGAPVSAGTYAVLGTFAGNQNYEPATGSGSLTIGKATAVVSVMGGTFTYDGATHAATGNVVGGGGASLGVPAFTYDGGSALPLNAGTYAVVGSFAGDANHEPATGGGTLTINRAAPVVSVVGGTFTYDGSSHPATGSVTGIGGATIGAPGLTYNGDAAPPVNAGTYAVLASFAGDLNYQPATGTGSVLIQRAAPILTWSAPAPIVYGTALSGTELNAQSSVPGSFAYTPGPGTVPGAGPRVLSATFTPADAVNYLGGTVTAVLSVNRAPLTVTANDATKVSGAPLPPFGVTYAGFVNGDTAASLDVPVTVTTTATAASPAGTYPITPGGAADANYVISFVAGTLTVTPPAVTSLRDQLAAVRLSLLGQLPTGNRKTDDAIKDAIESIEDALKSSQWTDGNHLNRKGERTFEGIEDAVEDLMRISRPSAAISGAIDKLVGIARQLAVIAINDARAAGGRARDIAKAESELAQGDRRVRRGDFDRAVQEFKEAWHDAQRAQRIRVDDDDHDHDCERRDRHQDGRRNH